MDLAGSEGAQGGNEQAGFVYDQLQNSKLSKDAAMSESRDELEEQKEKPEIEDKLKSSNVTKSEPKKNSQKTYEFFQKLKCSNPTQKYSIEPQVRDPPRL